MGVLGLRDVGFGMHSQAGAWERGKKIKMIILGYIDYKRNKFGNHND